MGDLDFRVGGGGVILSSGYITQGENQTVEGGLTLLFPRSGRRYGVLQNAGHLQFSLQLYRDERAFLRREKKKVKMTEFHLTGTIQVHSLEMMLGNCKKPQHILIIVHAGLPMYYKPHRSAEMMRWITGFYFVANAMARKVDSSSSEDRQEGAVVNRVHKQKRHHEDSGFAESPTASRKSSDASNDPEEGTNTENADASVVKLLPEVIEMDVPEEGEENDDEVVDESVNAGREVKEAPCRRSRLVLKEDRYEEQFVGPTLNPDPVLPTSIQRCTTISEEEEESNIPPAPPLVSLEEMRKATVKVRVSTFPTKPTFDKDITADPPYQRTVFKTEKEQNDPDENFPPNAPVGSLSMAQWKTSDLVKSISKQLEGRQAPIGRASRDSLKSKISKAKRPMSQSSRRSEVKEEEDEEDGGENPGQSPEADQSEIDPPYDRLSKFKREGAQEQATEGNNEIRSSSGEVVPVESRKRLPSNPHIGSRPLPNPINQETDWRDVRNMQYEKTCRFLKVVLDKNDVISNTLALVTINQDVYIAGWRKEVAEKIYGKLHVGDRLIQVYDMKVDTAEVAQMFIKSCAKDEVVLIIQRLPHATISELRKNADQPSWGIETTRNEIKEVTGPAAEGGIPEKAQGALSARQTDWVVTELAHQRVPIVKCAPDEVSNMLEKMSMKISLVLVLHPRDFIHELRDGLKQIKHPSQYYV